MERKGLKSHKMLGHMLVSLLVDAGCISQAHHFIDCSMHPNEAPFHAIMHGYVKHNMHDHALIMYERMKTVHYMHQCICPRMFVALLKSCAELKDLERGRELHCKIEEFGLLGVNAFIGSSLIYMYSSCGCLAEARKVLDTSWTQDAVMWTSLIGGYCMYGSYGKAMDCFEQMQKEGYSPNSVTFACVLKACGSIQALNKGIQVHADIIREGLRKRDVLLGTALVDMYAKCGDLARAQEMFNELPIRDVVAWNAIISGYAQHGHGEEALHCFRRMRQDNLLPNVVTFVCTLKACGSLGASEKGQEIHSTIVKGGLLRGNVILGYALVDMYAKCGALKKAQGVFDELPVRDVVAWNGLLSGYAQLGEHDIVFNAFDEMVRKGVVPTSVTFTVLLNACTHSGLLENAETYFDMMCSSYGIIPTLEHHTCMVDLFGRAGHVDKAVAVIGEMQFPADLAMCHTLLSACERWGNVNLGRFVFEYVVQLDEKDAGPYVCLGNMYAACERIPSKIETEWKKTRSEGI